MKKGEKLKIYYWEKYHRINDKGIVERQCTQCGEWLEENTDNFYMMNKSKPELGFSSKCKICFRKDSVEYRHRDIEKTREKDNNYYNEHKDLCHTRMNSYRGKNHTKIKKKEKEWQQSNPDKLKEYNLRHRTHDITASEWLGCLSVLGNKCAYCGLPYEQHIVKRNDKYICMKLHKDHVDYNGYNDLRNAVPGCQNCNSSKSQDDMEEWFRKQKFFSEEKLALIKWWISEGYKDYIEDKPPYRILRERNKNSSKYHFNLWSVDEMRNVVEIIATKDKKKDLEKDIKDYLTYLNS